MENLPSSPNGRNGSRDTVTGDDALLLAAAAMVPYFGGNLAAAHNAASDLGALGDAKKRLIAGARHKIRTKLIEADWSKGVRTIIGQNNIARAEPIFLERLKTLQGDDGELTITNTLILFGAHIHIFRGLKEWRSEGFTNQDLLALKNLFDSPKNFA